MHSVCICCRVVYVMNCDIAGILQVKIWFQNHRYKTKKALKDQNHADHRTTGVEPVPPAADRAQSPRKVSAPPLMAKNGRKCSTEDDDDDWKRRPPTTDVLPSDQQVVPMAPPGLGFRSSPADRRPGDALGFPASMYVGETQPPTPPMFSTPAGTGSVPGEFQLAVDEYRVRLQEAVAARPSSRSPADSAPSPFTNDTGLASVLYGHRETPTAVGAPMGYYYPPYNPSTNNGGRSLDRHIASPLGYFPMSSLRSW